MKAALYLSQKAEKPYERRLGLERQAGGEATGIECQVCEERVTELYCYVKAPGQLCGNQGSGGRADLM